MFSDALSARSSVEKIEVVSTNFCLQFGETILKGAEPTQNVCYSLCISVVLRPFVQDESAGQAQYVQRSIEVRSANQCCIEEAISITYCEYIGRPR